MKDRSGGTPPTPHVFLTPFFGDPPTIPALPSSPSSPSPWCYTCAFSRRKIGNQHQTSPGTSSEIGNHPQSCPGIPQGWEEDRVVGHPQLFPHPVFWESPTPFPLSRFSQEKLGITPKPPLGSQQGWVEDWSDGAPTWDTPSSFPTPFFGNPPTIPALPSSPSSPSPWCWTSTATTSTTSPWPCP